MTEDRHNERDSQLSAMFDGELPGGECELLARRLTRDDALRAQWSRYSMIGAALRAERGVAIHDRVARNVQSVVAKEATYGESNGADAAKPAPAVATARSTRRGWARLGYPLAGASIAAGVAAVSILTMRGFDDPASTALQASTTAPTTIVLTPENIASDTASGSTVAVNNAPAALPSNGEPERYSTPAPSSMTSIAPPARLANYVVAHSEYSGPLQRRMALLGIVGNEGDPDGEGSITLPTDGVPAADANGQGDNGQ
jgi:sigma-E factor negative regulatory protein RseA